METATKQMITVNGVRYEVLSNMTISDLITKGLVGSASYLKSVGIVREMLVKRPNGKKVFMVHEYNDETFTKPEGYPLTAGRI